MGVWVKYWYFVGNVEKKTFNYHNKVSLKLQLLPPFETATCVVPIFVLHLL